MSVEQDFLIDPITARRYLAENSIWIGNKNNVETLGDLLANIATNCRDLKCRLLLLQNKVNYILNAPQILPHRTKYYTDAQALDNLPPCILRHNNGFIKQARPGIDYVDYKKITDDYICITRSDISGQNNKYIDVSNLRIEDIENLIEDYEQFKIEFKAEIKAEIELALQPIVNVINNVNIVITNLPDIINKTVHEHITQNITQEITDIIQQTINTKEIIEQIIQYIHNNNYGFNFDEFLNELTIKIELLNRFIEALQQNFNELNLEFNLSNDIIQYLTATINSLSEQITNITNNYGGTIEINPELNPNIDIGNLEIQLTELLTTCANFQAYVNMVLFSIFPLITSGSNECIAWDLAHDQSQINFTDSIIEQDYTFLGELSPSRIYHNLKTWSEHQFFTFEQGVNPRFIIRSDFSSLNDRQRLINARSIGLSILSNSFNGWSFSLAPKIHSNLLRLDGEQLLISPIRHNEEQNPIISLSNDEIATNKPILIPTPTENADIKQAVNIEFLEEQYRPQLANVFVRTDVFQTAVSTHRAELDTMLISLNQLQNDYNTQNSTIASLNTQLTNHDSLIANLDTRVFTLEQSSGNNNNQSSANTFTIYPSSFLPPLTFKTIEINLTVANQLLRWDSITCHPLTGQWIIGSSNVPGVIACSDDDGINWELLPQLQSIMTPMAITPTNRGWFFVSQDKHPIFGFQAVEVPNLDIHNRNNESTYMLSDSVGRINNVCYDFDNNYLYYANGQNLYYSTNYGASFSSTMIAGLSEGVDTFVCCNFLNGHVIVVQYGKGAVSWFYKGQTINTITYGAATTMTGTDSYDGVIPTSYGGFAPLYKYSGQTNTTTGVTTVQSMSHKLFTPYKSSMGMTTVSSFSGGFITVPHWFSRSLLFLDPIQARLYDIPGNKTYELYTYDFSSLVPLESNGIYTAFITGGYGRTCAVSLKTGRTIILTNSNTFLYC